ncbi:hypothetical protein E2C01_039614 [Portunus trituberculatus]|uniref:Uncharacterized protein n=1 Tax=Portunus trituberculatus TaxID=210409 RepID=A0A5B7FLS2_PORTR|nr:hypothetical protein [Portunus trituberculatus]
MLLFPIANPIKALYISGWIRVTALVFRLFPQTSPLAQDTWLGGLPLRLVGRQAGQVVGQVASAPAEGAGTT